MRREFQREIYKLETTDKKLNRDLKKAIDKKEPMVIIHLKQATKKMTAQALLKNQRFILRYKNLDAQLQNTIFE